MTEQIHPNEEVQSPEELNEQMQVRIGKMHKMEEVGIMPFGHRFLWTHHAKDIAASGGLLLGKSGQRKNEQHGGDEIRGLRSDSDAHGAHASFLNMLSMR